MDARFLDGLTARSWPVELDLGEGRLTFSLGEAVHEWPLDATRIEVVGDMVRLSRGGDERLQVDAMAWRAATGARGEAMIRHRQGGERRLVIGLIAVGLTVAGVVFVGLPLAAGPMARRTPPALEQRLGETFSAQMSLGLKACEGQAGQAGLHRLGSRLQAATETPFQIRVRAVRAPMINAFALPGGEILVTSGLIDAARSPDELGGVIAHEVAHVEKRHVMQGVWRSLGVGLLLEALVGGGSGAGQQAVLLAASMSDLRYSRRAEAEADARGMELLQAQGLSSRGMASFFDRLASQGESRDETVVKELISSHPASRRRADLSRAHARSGSPAFTPTEWAAIKAACAPTGPGPAERLKRR